MSSGIFILGGITFITAFVLFKISAFIFLIQDIKEEVQMEETFGEDYLTYKGKVRRWL